MSSPIPFKEIEVSIVNADKALGILGGKVNGKEIDTLKKSLKVLRAIGYKLRESQQRVEQLSSVSRAYQKRIKDCKCLK